MTTFAAGLPSGRPEKEMVVIARKIIEQKQRCGFNGSAQKKLSWQWHEGRQQKRLRHSEQIAEIKGPSLNRWLEVISRCYTGDQTTA